MQLEQLIDKPMKKFLICTFLVSFVCFANAQTLSFSYNGSAVGESDTLTVVASGETELVAEGVYGWSIQFRPHLHNNSVRNVTVKVHVDKLSETATYCSSVCAGMCLEGSESAAFEIEGQGVYTNAYVDFVVPEGAEDGLFKVNLSEVDNPENTAAVYVIIKRPQVSISSVDNANAFKMYPNPATSSVSIDLGTSADATVAIYDLQGRQVRSAKTDKGQSAITIPLNDLPSGVYSCGVSIDGEMPVMKKLVVK